MLTIHKFTLDRGGRVDLHEADVEVQTAHIERWLRAGYDPAGKICVWALVDDAVTNEPHSLLVRGTGQSCEEFRNTQVQHIGSVIDRVHGFVWHIFAI